MADINVQKKERSVLPWIIGLIILALLAWILLSMLGGDEGGVVEQPVVEEMGPAGADTLP